MTIYQKKKNDIEYIWSYCGNISSRAGFVYLIIFHYRILDPSSSLFFIQ